MKIITIKNNGWGSLTIHDGKLPKSRLEWQAGNKLQVFVLGPMTDCYDLACAEACTYALDMGISAGELRRQSKSSNRSQFTTDTRKLL